MSDETRTERTQGLKERLIPAERAALLQIRHTDGYEVLLDIMEKACVEQETRLINLDVSEEPRILAEHKMAKAFWQVFVALQTKVEVEISIHLAAIADAEQHDVDRENFDPEQEMLKP